MCSTFGHLFRVSTAGVQPRAGLSCHHIDGCPPGLPLSVDDLLLRWVPPSAGAESEHRHAPRKEEDLVSKSGRASSTAKPTGPPSASSSGNSDSTQRRLRRDQGTNTRPGHADSYLRRQIRHPGDYARRRPDWSSRPRDGAPGRRRARSPKSSLAQHGMRILGYVKQVGMIQADIVDPTMVTLDMVEASPVCCFVLERAAEMQRSH